MGDFNTPLSPLDRSFKQKLNKETIELNNTINNLDLIDIYRIYHPTSSGYTFFSAAHGSFSKIDHILCYRANLSNYKGVEILPCILSDHNGMKLEINNKMRKEKSYITWRLNNMLLNEQRVTEDIKEEIKKFLEVNENSDTTYQNLWDTVEAVLRGKFISWSSFLKRKSQQINDLTLHLEALEKEEQISSKYSRRQEIIKIRAEINEIETKETIEKIDKTKSWFFEKINKIDRPLATLTKRRRERTQITSLRDEKGNITTDNSEIQKIIRNYFETLYSNKIEDSEGIDKFLKTYELARLSQDDINNLNNQYQVRK